MDYEQIKKDIKEIVDVVKELPEEYRQESFSILLSIYYAEKSRKNEH